MSRFMTHDVRGNGWGGRRRGQSTEVRVQGVQKMGGAMRLPTVWKKKKRINVM